MIAFTICSNNYLSHAKTLGDSFLKFHPDFKFLIGLVDKFSPEIDYKQFKDFTIILVEDLQIKNFYQLCSKYAITELNTAVKPSYFHYIFREFDTNKVIYIDPDILVTSKFIEVIEELDFKNIIITPHILTPIDDEYIPTDYHTLRGGVFNLGFLALSNYQNVKGFLNWWHDRVIKYGFANFSLNMFYDQLWINYVPAFFDNYFIEKHPGYNMANWNLHERYLSEDENGNYLVNKDFKLRFFHFSSYKYDRPDVICSYLTRYNFQDRSDLITLFQKYHSLLKTNGVEEIKNTSVYYYPGLNHANVTMKKSIVAKVVTRIKKSFRVLRTGEL